GNGDACDLCPGYSDQDDEDGDSLPDGCDTPIAPTGLNLLTISSSQIDLSWVDNSIIESGYRIERRQGQTGLFSEITQVSASIVTYSDPDLESSSEYCYRIFAFNNNGDSDASDVACAATWPEPITFSDVTDDYNLQNSFNSLGAAWGDVDNDYDDDLFLANSNDDNNLFVYDAPGTIFNDEASTWNIVDDNNSISPVWADYDNDGDEDLFVAVNNGTNRFYRNDGTSFSEIGDQIGLTDDGSAKGAAWADFDLDGDVDLYLCRAIGDANRLYRNDNGVFVDVAAITARNSQTGRNADLGLTGDKNQTRYPRDQISSTDSKRVGASDLDPAQRTGTTGANSDSRDFNRADSKKNNSSGPEETRDSDPPLTSDVTDTNSDSRGCAWSDFDNDGDPDLYVANNGQANRLFLNDGGTFSDVAGARGVAGSPGNSYGCAWSDFDNDGDFDLYVANIGIQNNRLYQNDDGFFTEIAATAGVAGSVQSTAPAWAEVDNDGDPDLYVGNRSGSADYMFINDQGQFSNQAATMGIINTNETNSAAWADIGGDGDLDLYIANTGNNFLYQNSGNNNRWLHVRLHGDGSNGSAIGGRVRIVVDGQAQIREVEGGSGLMSQNSRPVEFGLGSATLVDSVLVDFPAGNSQLVVDVDANQIIDIHETDLTPPGKIDDMVLSDATSYSITVSWTAPGDNGFWGTADSYDLRWSENSIADETAWDQANTVDDEPIPLAALTTQSYTLQGLSPTTYYYLAIKTMDEQGNISLLSSQFMAQSGPDPNLISGTVYETDTSDPLSAIVVEIWDSYPDGAIVGADTTAADGGYFVDGLNAGQFYDLRARSQGPDYPYFPEVLPETAVETIDADFYLTATPNIVANPSFCEFLCLSGSLFLEYPLRDGDVILASDPRGSICGKGGYTIPGGFHIFVYGAEDPDIVPPSGPLDGETINFAINQYPAQVVSGSPIYYNMEIIELCLSAGLAGTNCIPLLSYGTGWNLISWNVDTANDSIAVIFADVMEQIVVILSFGYDDEGVTFGALSYNPSLPPEFSNMHLADHFKGYWVKVTEDQTLCLTGAPVNPQTEIPLVTSWNLISYLPAQADSTYHAIESVIDNTIVVFGFDPVSFPSNPAQSYHTDPDLLPFSNLLVMKPGYGYWIKMANPDTLVYPVTQLPAIQDNSVMALTGPSLSQTSMLIPTNRWLEIYGRNLTVDGDLLPVGTIISAVDENGVICGMSEVTRPGQFGLMPVYADDPFTDQDEGLLIDEQFRLHISNPDLDIDYLL
ncbi:MAG: hypothetical protein GY869_24290, partial [Planctomycetes bacterium]|nr:hypothetical protein [Planctomycetota bacterium]